MALRGPAALHACLLAPLLLLLLLPNVLARSGLTPQPRGAARVLVLPAASRCTLDAASDNTAEMVSSWQSSKSVADTLSGRHALIGSV